jgi:hypothetical protein
MSMQKISQDATCEEGENNESSVAAGHDDTFDESKGLQKRGSLDTLKASNIRKQSQNLRVKFEIEALYAEMMELQRENRTLRQTLAAVVNRNKAMDLSASHAMNYVNSKINAIAYMKNLASDLKGHGIIESATSTTDLSPELLHDLFGDELNINGQSNEKHDESTRMKRLNEVVQIESQKSDDEDLMSSLECLGAEDNENEEDLKSPYAYVKPASEQSFDYHAFYS